MWPVKTSIFKLRKISKGEIYVMIHNNYLATGQIEVQQKLKMFNS